ncbi:hypothetical protein NADFUDRAFT_49860 [Nadsonia fulvescens var. elongata DSM 6958]|uniref:Kinetochore protein NDC80 n=1 Tax=Nadsonia fulvescens var. elongata DSM 6958 TaxID=857566 RepID=A0A1E3PPR7_9ASCO|nr:hypothetical protein NADFUDRAFT_49860 [Nadsonia fulvescens var. elongata DSM 6958]
MSREPPFFDVFSASKRRRSISTGVRNSQALSTTNGYYPAATGSTPMKNPDGDYHQYNEPNLFGNRFMNSYNPRASMVSVPTIAGALPSRIPDAPMSLNRNRSSIAGSRPSNIGAPQRSNGSLLSPAKRAIKTMTSSRKSIAHLPPTNTNRGPAFSNNRRQSIYTGLTPAASTNINRRQSFHPATPAMHQPSINHNIPSALSTIPKDPRPLRDKAYQAEISQTIYEYLVNNKFDLEMKHPLLQKTVRSPTQKDFVLMYQFLYRRLDPEYNFVRGFDVEVFQSLRALGYPYVDTMSRNELSAVGQNWPPYLGLIYWLTEANMALDSLLDIEEDEEAEKSEEYLDKLTYEFTTKAYLNYLNNDDDYSQYEAELRMKIQEYNTGIVQLIDQTQAEADGLEQKDQELLIPANELEAAERKKAILDDDDLRVQEYINNLKDYKDRYTSLITKLEDQESENKMKLTSLRDRKKSIELEMSTRKITPSEIEQAKRQNTQLSVTVEKNYKQIKELSQSLKTKEQETREVHEELEPILQSYNLAAREISDIIHSLKGRIDHHLDIDFNIDLRDILDTDKLGMSAEKRLKGKNIWRDIRDKLKNLRTEARSSSTHFSGEYATLANKLNKMAEIIKGKIAVNEANSVTSAKNKRAYADKCRMMESCYNEKKAEVGRIENKIQATKAAFNKEHSQVIQSYGAIDEKHDDLAKSIDQARVEVVTQINDLVEFLAQRQDNIQHTFLEFESLIDEDLNEWEH